MSRVLGVIALLLACQGAFAQTCGWPLWQAFKHDAIRDGQVLDISENSIRSTSEGQAYALFFALVANDQVAFADILDWTETNLADGDLSARLPAWLWGKSANGEMKIVDPNPASDADLWMAYSLYEAGRLWKKPRYATLGYVLASRILHEETYDIPGVGLMLLPGPKGFVHGSRVRLNPSYLTPQLFDLMAIRLPNSTWPALRDNNEALLPKLFPKGFAADWIDSNHQQLNAAASRGSYDAIRTYLWAGMLASDHSLKPELSTRMAPMVAYIGTHSSTPEIVDVATGKGQGRGPFGFSAALLPLLANAKNDAQLEQQKEIVLQALNKAEARNNYYNHVLSLFGLGWLEGRYRFDVKGQLHARWEAECK